MFWGKKKIFYFFFFIEVTQIYLSNFLKRHLLQADIFSSKHTQKGKMISMKTSGN